MGFVLFIFLYFILAQPIYFSKSRAKYLAPPIYFSKSRAKYLAPPIYFSKSRAKYLAQPFLKVDFWLHLF